MASRSIRNRQEYELPIRHSLDHLSHDIQLRRMDKVFGCRRLRATGWAIRKLLSNQTGLFPHEQHHSEGE
jgi:hypothetical protein